MRILRWDDLVPEGQSMHVNYVTRSEGGSWKVHGHDFYEVFWIDSGIGRHIVEGAGTSALVSGQMVYIRPRDCHGFAAEAAREPFSLINIAFAADAWKRLRTRYRIDNRHPFLNDSAVFPPCLETGAAQHRELSAFFHHWIHQPRTALNRDAFLLGLASRTGESPSNKGLGEAPAWLRRGLLGFEGEPALWSGGSAALAAQCGCSRTHLARIMKSVLGQTPSDWILNLRLERAVRLLETTGFSITDIAGQSGFENLSHFYRCFYARHRQTPLRFRKAVRRETV